MGQEVKRKMGKDNPYNGLSSYNGLPLTLYNVRGPQLLQLE